MKIELTKDGKVVSSLVINDDLEKLFINTKGNIFYDNLSFSEELYFKKKNLLISFIQDPRNNYQLEELEYLQLLTAKTDEIDTDLAKDKGVSELDKKSLQEQIGDEIFSTRNEFLGKHTMSNNDEEEVDELLSFQSNQLNQRLREKSLDYAIQYYAVQSKYVNKGIVGVIDVANTIFDYLKNETDAK